MSFPQITPARPVPGAFFVTPAAPRTQGIPADSFKRRLFADTDGGSRPPPPGAGADAVPDQRGLRGSGDVVGQGQSQPQPQPPPSPPEYLSPVSRAAQAINHCLELDKNYPEMDSYCRQGASSDYDMPVLDSAWAPFHKTQMYPIPNQVFEYYNAGRMQTLMGLFAEINHAWVAIDNSLFLWDYTDPDPELIGFEEQPSTVQAVSLVPPRPGIFVETITHVLVVATTTDMIILGLHSEKTAAGTTAVSLYQTNMTLPLRGQDVRIVRGSANGRVFFGGSGETDLHELFYEKEERWFRGRCGKLNHTNPRWLSLVPAFPGSFFSSATPEYLVDIAIDDTRQLIYTLSSASTIRTYHMEEPNHVVRVIEKDKYNCLRDITHMISSSPLLTDRMTIVSISSVTSRESARLHLMALTDTGCRLFFSATSAASFMATTTNVLAPQSMQVQFIKFPPSQRPSSGPQHYGSETVVDLSSRALELSRFGKRFAPGHFLDFVCKEGYPNEDLLFVSAPETGRIKNTPAGTPGIRYFEHGNWIEIGSKAEDVGLVTKPFAAAAEPRGFGNELAVQFDEPPSEFAVLTNTGVHIIRRRRLVDVFAASMRAATSDEGLEAEARKFTQHYGRVETVSAALAVACGHGSETRPGAARAVDQATQDRASIVFVDFGGNPTLAESDGSGSALTTDMVRLSSRHDALCLYLARTVRMLWKSPVIKTSANPNGGGFLVESAVPGSRLLATQENLQRLRKFLDANRNTIQGLSGPASLQSVANRQDEVALQAEHQALHALEKLMEAISEGISFVLMLFDERVSDIYSRLDDSVRGPFNELTYERLFSHPPGKDFAKLLVRAIVYRNIESGSNVETVADALRRRCGSFCSPDDVVVFRAQEQLQRASDQDADSHSTVKRALLLESVRLFESVARSLTHDNLSTAVHQYIHLRYYAGAVRLCLTAAHEKDRGDAALAWMREGRPANDPRQAAFFARRKCYNLVHDALYALEETSAGEPEIVDGRPTLTATKRFEAYDVVNGSDDEVFHFDLYDWYIEMQWTDRILATESPHVETFLQGLAAGGPEHGELLCRFYTMSDRFYDAGKVQYELALSEFSIGLKDRITLLSRARSNVSVPTAGVGRQQQQQLNHQVTELLEIAHIQDDLLERLRVDSRFSAGRVQELEAALDGQILTLNELFNNYIDQANYYDLTLVVFHAADFRSATTIAATWRRLIENCHEEVTAKRQASADATGTTGDIPMPYESVSARIQAIAHSTSLDSFVFPIHTLIPEVCQYSIATQQDGRVGADPCWPVRLFLSLGVSHDMVARVLENIFDTQDLGFNGVQRYRVVEWIVHVLEGWLGELRRRGGNGAGRMNGNASIGAGSRIGGGPAGGVLAQWVEELLQRCEAALPPPGQGQNPGGEELPELRRKVKTVRRDVQGLLERGMGSSFRY